MAQLDLAIRGGTVVTADTYARADVGIAGGVVVQIGGDFEAANELDAGGKLLLPGGIDAHVHLTTAPGRGIDPSWVDDFTSGSRAALAGGITTVGNMAIPGIDETPLQCAAREAGLVAEQAIADVFLHPAIVSADQATLDEIPRFPAAGHAGIKIFMPMEPFELQITGYVEAIRRAGAARLMTLIHCEDYAIIKDATAHLAATGRSSLKHFADSRPVISELLAVQRMIAFSEATGAPVYIVHLSSQRALDACVGAHARGMPVYVETRPVYLHLTREKLEETDGQKYIGQPPLRDQADVDALWTGIQQGTVHTVCTDHAPWMLEHKLDPTLTMANFRPGVENLQTMLPMLYSEGVNKRRISLRRFVEVTATNAAKLFGIYPQKGTIAPGSDADIVIFDPTLTRTITNDMLFSNVDYTPYDGWEVTGWPIVTLRRGEIVFQNDEITGQPGSGRIVRQGSTQLL